MVCLALSLWAGGLPVSAQILSEEPSGTDSGLTAQTESESESASEIKESLEESLVKGLPSGDVITPPLPPDLTVPADAPPPSPAPALGDARSSEALIVPQDPLQVRIESVEGLSLDQALDLAVAQNLAVEQARLAILRAGTSLDQALAAFSPTFSTTWSYLYNQPPTGGSPFVEDSSRISVSLLRLDYTFLDSGRRSAAVDSAQEAVEIAELRLDQVIQDTRLAVASAYYQVQQANALVAINEASVESSLASLRDAQAQERAGLGTRFSVLQAETELANNRQTLIRAQNDQQLAQRALAEQLNFSIPTDVDVIDPIRPQGNWELTLENTIVQALNNRPELEIQRRLLEQSKDQARSAIASIQPQVNLFATFDFGGDIQVRNSTDTGYAAGANFNWTWFDDGASNAAAQGFDIDALTAARTFEQIRNQIRRTTEDAFFTLINSRQAIDSSKTAITSAEESLRLARLRFQAGVGTQTDVIAAETALTTARGNLSNSIIAYNLALVQLRRQINQL
ncbi:MAG: TolC family protein [Synechococcaceae cyanobacterium SM2_3_1]|nr:TolC family protein [Synechococcaceae cyanobacterium SM2_3_1]